MYERRGKEGRGVVKQVIRVQVESEGRRGDEEGVVGIKMLDKSRGRGLEPDRSYIRRTTAQEKEKEKENRKREMESKAKRG